MQLNELIDILKDCYRKYKSYISFSPNLEYAKEAIYLFEDNRGNMEKVFNDMATHLLKEEKSYFDSLCKKIDIIPVIKSIKDDKGENISQVISNKYDQNEKIVISKLNFFAKLPIELSILDTFWSVIFGVIIRDIGFDFGWGANILSDQLFKKGNDILSSINFKNLSLFKSYYPQYLKWKNKAIEEAKRLHSKNNDLSIFSIDVSRYFYNVDIDFSSLHNELISIKSDYASFTFLEGVISNIYVNGNKKLHKLYKTTKGKNTILLGPISSMLLGNFYLKKVDRKFKSDSNIKYYGRYVDDILIVINKVDFDDTNSLFEKYLKAAISFNGTNFHFVGFKDLKIQTEKTTIIKIYSDQSDAILRKLSKELHPSEPKLFPSYGQNMEEFLKNINSKEEIIKFRDAKTIKIDVKKLISSINGYLGLHKNTRVTKTTKKTEFKKQYVDELMLLLSPKTLLSLCQRWDKIYLFAWLNKSGNDITFKLKYNIKKAISSFVLKPEDGEYCDSKRLKNMLKRHLNSLFDLAQASALAISGFRERTSINNSVDLYRIAIKLRKSNLLDYNALALPMVNYLPDSDLKMSLNLFEISLSERKGLSKLEFDKDKIKYSPRFIHLSDYLFFFSYKGFSRGEYTIDFNSEFGSYLSLTKSTFGQIDIPLQIKATDSKNEIYKSLCFEINDSSYLKDNTENIMIGLANINLEIIKKSMITKRGKITRNPLYSCKDKQKFFELLNSCFTDNPRNNDFIFSKKNIKGTNTNIPHKEPVSYLVFPEAYLPYEWLPDLLKYCKDTGTVVITGLRYVIDGKKVYNLQAVIIPYRNQNFYKQTLLFIREKNNYAPFEKETIANSGMTFSDHNNPFYFKFNFHNTSFCTFICYEMTDIFARALIRNNTDLVFASEYNYDIVYFSNIAESVSRDLSCFVVQVNSSTAGDTRIVAPYRDKFKNLANIKGGIRDTVHIGTINLKELKDYIKAYNEADKTYQYKKLSTDKKYQKMKKPSAGSRK